MARICLALGTTDSIPAEQGRYQGKAIGADPDRIYWATLFPSRCHGRPGCAMMQIPIQPYSGSVV
jgi:hypothetical protein